MQRPTLACATERHAFLQRLAALDSSCQVRWGTMTPLEMLSHLGDTLRLALGERPCVDKSNFLTRTLVKRLILGDLPMPKGAPTSPEFDPRKSGTRAVHLAAQMEEVEHLVDRVAHRGDHERWGVHPIFGKLTGSQWKRLCWKHGDHHLRQFGL